MSPTPDAAEEPMDRLIAAHPLLFRGEEPAVFSFLPRGWYALVHKRCSDFETELGPQGCTAYKVRQVKEKLGTLRFYFRLNGDSDLYVDLMSGASVEQIVKPAAVDGADPIRALIHQAMAESERTCQRCGCPGSLRNLSGWLVTFCQQHMTEHLNTGDRTTTPSGS